jgi:hypothetical protein
VGVVHRRRLAQRLYRELFGVRAFVDIIIETPERCDELKDKCFLIYRDIVDSGSVIYEKRGCYQRSRVSSGRNRGK